ncbi:Serine/threonine protein kinase [Micromonospora purpureochromogenes]|uniref:non-specific serine/threonine protein kinase n=1 Tax=Micromonospora purpureochromogenes TaxID=47872 RepID=A0A1C4UDU5_9ACTN|nr:serine/threonine-protein kinase [Micromonospora purpureochromogenes]SCE69829.1 Serine/threonine protein kinase [Micromonospora purpureochromogenes]
MVHSEQSVTHGPGTALGVDGCTDAVEVGRGGFGVVYRAWQPDFARWVAVKVLAADWHGPSRARFERELRMLGRLSDHPHIVTLHQAGRTAAGNPYLLMAYEEGGSLGDRLRDGAAGDWREAVAGGIAVAGALETAHRAGVLHRDVKPENILISGYGEPKLADFGQARPRSARPTGADGRVTASVLHAAPEVLRGEPASVAADVYALASTVLHWIRGAPPFAPADGESVESLLCRIAVDPVPDLRPLGVPDGVCAALERALAKDPARRPATAAAFAEELRAAQVAAGLPLSPFVLGGPGGDPAEPWPPQPAAGEAAPLSLSDRRRAALALSATVTRRPSRVRRHALTRSLGLLVALATVLAAGGSRALPTPAPVELPAQVPFGELELNAESPEQVVAVGNRADRPVRLTGLTLTGPSRSDLRIVADGCTTRPLAPGDRCAVRLVAVPHSAGPIRASLELTVDGRRFSTPVVGTGRPRSASRDDAPPGPCYADAYQVGASAYGHAGGLRAISVKQYWSPSCRATMAYVWVWKQYRDNAATGGGTWTVDLGVRADRPTPARQRAVGQPYELWTEPYPSAGRCTTATATVTADRSQVATTATTEPWCDR